MSKAPKTTGYKIGQDNITPFGLDIHNPVFLVSGIPVEAFVFVTLAFQEGSIAFFGWLRPFLTSTFDWFFLRVRLETISVRSISCQPPCYQPDVGDEKPGFGA